MIVIVLRQGGKTVRVLLAESPLPADQRRRLEKGGITVEEYDRPTVARVYRQEDFAELVTPLLQTSLFG
jgi:hypothetical protein